MPEQSATTQRMALGDASNRANSHPAKVTSKKQVMAAPSFEAYFGTVGITDVEKKKILQQHRQAQAAVPGPSAAKQPDATGATGQQAGAATARKPAASSGKKCKSETSLEDETTAYKQNLDHIVSPAAFDDINPPTCDTVRWRINKLLDSGIMTKTEFARAIGRSSRSTPSSFLSKTGTMGGCDSSVYYNARAWFRQREVAKLKMPDSTSGLAKTRLGLDVPMRTCGGRARSQAQFYRDLYARLRAPKCKGIQTAQLAKFRAGKGARTGAKELRLLRRVRLHREAVPRGGMGGGGHREATEVIWAWSGGFNIENDSRTGFFVSANSNPYMDRYGRIIIENLAGGFY
ncbi:hypothetical protein F5X99DRAFT_427655 [Biscogniauxia marginata]|nr:hypothetical protein F5X99DRAFT_427655 [Biscogniauxia marginata]